VMGLEVEMYDITAITLVRNDSRAQSFASNLRTLQQRALTLPQTPHWCKTSHDLVRGVCVCVCVRARACACVCVRVFICVSVCGWFCV
jgi:hypothetical protein